jgi:KUP system potassium uptake protein
VNDHDEQASAPKPPPSRRDLHAAHGHGESVAALALGALGVVYGDIGTSPLYTLKECLAVAAEHADAATRDVHDDVLGILSLIFWSLTMVVTVKYLAFIMRADSRGEGGIFALLALVPERFRTARDRIPLVPVLVVVGAALLYGDGAITPAISVLSAIEGIGVAKPELAHWVVPLTCAILLGLFALQSRGTATVGKLFGPIMIAWFGVIGGLGAWHVIRNPSVLVALSPTWAAAYFARHGLRGAAILGSVVLAVTGGEALYADMGHFGAKPIRVAWLGFVLPALSLCYFGQGALVLAHPEAAENPFFAMAPRAFTLPMVLLSSGATIIASQALITGAFSLTRQAIQLGYFPRVTVRHTAKETQGQIYLPHVNWMLAAACLALVVEFRESGRLAAAYGLAVTGTMGITTLVYAVVARETWGWSLGRIGPLVALFLVFDIAFFGANLLKFVDGGWVPALIGAVLTAVMLLWSRGRNIMRRRLFSGHTSLDRIGSVTSGLLGRLPGVGAFMAATDSILPPVLLQQVQVNKVLHEHVLLVTISTVDAPFVDEDERVEIRPLEHGFFQLRIRFGFMEDPSVPPAIARACARAPEIPFREDQITYFLRRETIVAGPKGEMGRLAEGLFAFLHRNAVPADRFFALPPERVVELGWQIDL